MSTQAEKLIYKSEIEPLVGSLPDRLRENDGIDNIYEIQLPHCVYTMRAVSDKVLFAALLLTTNKIPIVVTAPKLVLPYPDSIPNYALVFGNSFDNLAVFIYANFDEIQETLKSVLAGYKNERIAMLEVVAGIKKWTPRAKDRYIESWHQARLRLQRFDPKSEEGEMLRELKTFCSEYARKLTIQRAENEKSISVQIAAMKERKANMKFDR